MVRILVVDDHVVVRSGLIALLDGKHDINVIGDAADGDEAIAKALELKPDVVLMDFSMPPGKDGLIATTELKKLLPDTEVLILTMHDDDEYLFRAIQAGASGYILKSAPHEELITAIQSVAQGNAYLYANATKRLMSEYLDKLKQEGGSGPYESLSEREKEILSWVAKGYSNKEIAEHLVISVKTVESHKSNLMEKLNLKTRPELVKFAMKKGLLNYE
ncbi:response regulator transcription factor [Paenibacillus jiagnxiensis]|uniref:response regulator transcription factor n=1 Tax=Paenibacillus jiagnxiensis TaxID=3228926 RepID=UPI0033B66846